MKHIPFTTVVALVALSACGGGAPVEETAEDAAELTSQAQTAIEQQLATDQTATADAALAQAPPPIEEAPAEAEVPAETATPTRSPLELTLAAAATQQAPTLLAGQTLAAQTQAALPTPTPLVYEVLSSTTTETITQNDVEVTVTAIVPPSTSLSQVWSEVYAAPAGIPFTITTDEAAMALAIQNAMFAAGYGENVSELTVSLNNNLITLTFTVTAGGTSADGRISFAAFAQNGDAVITMTSLQFGRFTVPPEMLDALNAAIAQALTGAGDASQAQVTIEDIFIDDGQMTVTGIVGVEGIGG